MNTTTLLPRHISRPALKSQTSVPPWVDPSIEPHGCCTCDLPPDPDRLGECPACRRLVPRPRQLHLFDAHPSRCVYCGQEGCYGRCQD